MIFYGNCQKCGAEGVSRESRPNGNDRCKSGQTYPSKDAVSENGKPPLGLIPAFVRAHVRVDQILNAMIRFTRAGKAIPKDWIVELEIQNNLQNL